MKTPDEHFPEIIQRGGLLTVAKSKLGCEIWWSVMQSLLYFYHPAGLVKTSARGMSPLSSGWLLLLSWSYPKVPWRRWTGSEGQIGLVFRV